MFNLPKEKISTTEEHEQIISNVNESENVQLKKIYNSVMWILFMVSIQSIANKVTTVDSEIQINELNRQIIHLQRKINLLMLQSLENSIPPETDELQNDEPKTFSL